MPDEKKFEVVLQGTGEFVPDSSIFGGEEKRFYSVSPNPGDQDVTPEQYDELKKYKSDDGKQMLVKA